MLGELPCNVALVRLQGGLDNPCDVRYLPKHVCGDQGKISPQKRLPCMLSVRLLLTNPLLKQYYDLCTADCSITIHKSPHYLFPFACTELPKPQHTESVELTRQLDGVTWAGT
jgi:hypothetical protein